MEIDFNRIEKLECRITAENFESVAEALEAAFPFLRPFRDLLAYCVIYAQPDQDRVDAGELEVVITRWQKVTAEQMVGSFSMGFPGLFMKKGKDDTDEVGESVSFEPYRGDPAKLCKLRIFARESDRVIQPWIGIEITTTGDARATQLMAFASAVETFELNLVLSGGENVTVAPGDLL